MNDLVTLVGLDFGTTTSKAAVATARMTRNAVTGRTELTQVEQHYRSPMVFTPLNDGRLDLERVAAYLDSWLSSAGLRADEVFGGGALLTGLTAQTENAAGLVGLIRRRLGDVLIATADDPCLESWLAFLGSCGALAREHPDRTFINLDIGGGTTNLALGRAGQVLRTGCLFVGGRHIQVEPGTYRIAQLSRYARALLERCGIRKEIGTLLTEDEVNRLVDFDVGLLEAAIAGNAAAFDDPVAKLRVQVPFHRPSGAEAIVTFSGGVGELVYAHVQGQPWPATTRYGDLGVDLARRIVRSESLARDLHFFVPSGRGRATVYGLLRHNTEISGSTIFLPRPDVLPLADLPVLGSLSQATSDDDWSDLVRRLAHSPRGGCLFLDIHNSPPADLRIFAARLRSALKRHNFPSDQPLVLLLHPNLGKVLGYYITDWGKTPLTLIVIDEVPVRNAHYVHIGRLRQQVVPISFHGLIPSE